MNTNVTVRSELKKILSSIETLAHEAHTRLSSGSGILDLAHELVRNSIGLTFGVGELYATEQDNSNAVAAPAATPKRKMHSNWHNVRDSHGRFVRSTRP